MPAINFPNSPVNNQIFKDLNNNVTYIYVTDPESPGSVGKWRAAYLGEESDIAAAIAAALGSTSIAITDAIADSAAALLAANAAATDAANAIIIANGIESIANGAAANAAAALVAANAASAAAASAVATANATSSALTATNAALDGKVNRIGDTFTGTVRTPRLTVDEWSTANDFTGKGALPVGSIVMWYGAVANIPNGWRICDGGAGTPDMRNRFPVGTGLAYALGAGGGADTVALSVGNLPSHSHGVNAGVATDNINGGPFVKQIEYLDPSGGVGNWTGGSAWSTIGAGSNTPHENRPPFRAVHFIMRIN